MRPVSRSAGLLACAGLAILAFQACDGDASGPDVPSSITVTSPVDTILDLGRTATLQAAAVNARGEPVTGLQFDWSSSDPSVVSVVPVGASGYATAEGLGTATVTAATAGASGTIRLRVVDVDLGPVVTLTGDPYPDALVASLTAATSATVQPAWEACETGAPDGNVAAILRCVADIREEAASATDGTDRASLAVLGLYLDGIERSLGL